MVNVKHPYLKIATLIVLMALAPLGYAIANQPVTANHGVGVLKSASPSAFVGENVTYQIIVNNPSDFDLHNINVTDQLLGFRDTIPFMEKNNLTGVTYTLNRTVICSDPNPLVNTVNVEAIDSEGAYSTASAQAITTVKYWIQINKTGPYFAHEGEPIKYSIVVKNLADSPMANVTVRDELVGFSWRGDLSVGESNEFNLTYVVPLNAADPLINKVTAIANVNDTIICAQKTWSVDILKPKIEVEKTVVPKKVYPNENVTYTITVTNTGDAVLYNISLSDSVYGPAPAEIIPSSLSPGDSFAWSFNATINEKTINIANATAFDILGMKVYDLDEACVYVKPVKPVFGLNITATGTAVNITNPSDQRTAHLTFNATVEKSSMGCNELRVTVGSLTIGDKVYTIEKGWGHIALRCDKIIVHLQVKSPDGVKLHVVLKGTLSNGKVTFTKPQSKLAGQFFLALEGTLTKIVK